MRKIGRGGLRTFVLAGSFALALFLPFFAQAEEYGNALKGVKQISAVFDVSQGNPKMANVVFWAVKNSYEDMTVKALPQKPSVSVVFHGPVVKLLSTDPGRFEQDEWPEVEKFQNTTASLFDSNGNHNICVSAIR